MKLLLIAPLLAIASVIVVPDIEARITKRKRHGIRGLQSNTNNDIFSLLAAMPAPKKGPASKKGPAPKKPKIPKCSYPGEYIDPVSKYV